MRLGIRHIIILIIAVAIIVVGVGDAFAKKRTSKDVKREKQKTEQQIARTKKQIAENDRETGRQLNRLSSIKAGIAQRNDSIAVVKAHLDSINGRIKVLSDSISELVRREKMLKNNYGKTLRAIRSRRQGMNDMSFVFSSGSFSQAWRRIQYLQTVARTSTKQARQLATAKAEIGIARDSLNMLRKNHAAELNRQNNLQITLRAEQTAANNLVRNLRKQGKSLQRELDKRNRQAQSLARELDKIVEEEIRAAEERRRKEAAEAERRRKQEEVSTPSTPTHAPSPKKSAEKKFESEAEKDRRLTGSFASNKGRLLFPVAGKYSIISNFGTNELPELSKVKVDNLGIDIEVPAGANARAVFDGVVSSIFRLDGYNNIVIVRHGEYLSVYAGLGSLSVKKGDAVKTGQNLGTIQTRQSEKTVRLHFEIRHEKQKLNPAEWVR